jgi:hypothetical protein
MFGGKSLALVRNIRLTPFQLPVWKVTISPFAVGSIHAGWIATSTLVGLIFTIQLMGSLIVHGDYPDPFARYDSILPGHPIQALSEYPCSISQSRINGQLIPGYFSCSIFPQDGFFDIIHIEGRNDEITELTFYATHVSLGELALHWKPAIRPQSTGKTIEWGYGHYSLDVVGSKVDYQVPIRMFSIKGSTKS